MIPILYDSNETSFTTNGIGRLSDIVSGTVTEELNGVYECEFTYPINGKYFSEIREGRIIACYHDDTRTIQPFEIYGRSQPLNGTVTFYAHHISYRLNRIVLNPFTASSCLQAMAFIPNNAMNDCPFTFWTDIESTGDFKVNYPKTIREILGNEEESILDTFRSGEYEFDKFNVKLHLNRGVDRDVSIRYGKNLTEFNYETDTSESYEAVAPYWSGTVYDGETETPILVMLPEGFVVSSEVAEDFHSPDDMYKVKITPLDLTSYFDVEPSVSDLRAKAIEILEPSKAWQLKENFEISFEPVWTYDEYDDYSALQRVSLADKVSVYNPSIPSLEIKMEVIRVVYDFILEKYESMELGSPKRDFATSLSESLMAATDQLISQLPTKSFMDAAIDYATELITGGLGGHLVIKTNADGQPEELLIMDSDDPNTAVNVWRFNLGGLGHSHSGYNGPFDDVALTMDGKINASMITTGILNAGVIRTGLLSDRLSKNWWNLETGEFHISAESMDLDVGGTNLILGTKDMTSVGEARWAVYPSESSRIEDGVAYVLAPSNDYWLLRCVTGKKIKDYMNRGIVFSFDFYVENSADITDLTVTLNLRDDPYGSSIDTAYKQLVIPSSRIVAGKKNRLYIEFLPTSEDYFTYYSGKSYNGEYYISFRLHGYSRTNGAEVSRLKAEVGNVPTDWSPAPEDIDTGIATVDRKYTTISTTVDGINAEIGNIQQDIDGIDAQYTTLSATVDGISTEVSSFKRIGGTNYVLRSEDMIDESLDDGDARWEVSPLSTSEITDGIAYLTGSSVYVTGVTCEQIGEFLDGYITVSFDAYIQNMADKNDLTVTLLLNTDKHSTRLNYGWKNMFVAASNLAVGRTHRISATFNVPDLNAFNFYSGSTPSEDLYIAVRISGSAPNQLRISKIKMEKGVVSTDWAPSDKDIEFKYSKISQTVDGISTEVAEKVGNDEIISRINQSAEAIDIDADKISLTGKRINLSSDDIQILSTNGVGETKIYYAVDEFTPVDGYYPVLIGGRRGWLEIGYTQNGYVNIAVGDFVLAINSNSIGLIKSGSGNNYSIGIDGSGVSISKNGTVLEQWN